MSISITTISKSVVPDAISKGALKALLDAKSIPFTNKMNKVELWELTEQSQPKAELCREMSGEY